jgi:DNA polymerase-3 subunit epsilon
LGDDGKASSRLKVTEVPFAVIDFESAGSAPGLTDEPVQIAVIHWNGEEIKTALNSYLRPSRKVTWSAKEVHGIDDEMLVRAPLFVDLWPQVKASLSTRWVVAHGAATEKRFLRVFPFHGFGPWVDTLTLTRAVYPSLPSHALSDAVEKLGLTPQLPTEGFRWHDACSDAIATAVLLCHLIQVTEIDQEPAEILTRPNLTEYFAHRREKSRQT